MDVTMEGANPMTESLTVVSLDLPTGPFGSDIHLLEELWERGCMMSADTVLYSAKTAAIAF